MFVFQFITWFIIECPLQAKPPTNDGKHQVTTDTEIMSMEILKHRHLGQFMDRTQYLMRKVVIPLELPKTVRGIVYYNKVDLVACDHLIHPFTFLFLSFQRSPLFVVVLENASLLSPLLTQSPRSQKNGLMKRSLSCGTFGSMVNCWSDKPHKL